jgi:hypothetical protein
MLSEALWSVIRLNAMLSVVIAEGHNYVRYAEYALWSVIRLNAMLSVIIVEGHNYVHYA